jgi:hypothetical protein
MIPDGILDTLIMNETHSAVPENRIYKLSVKAYYLSILNIIKEIHKNPILEKFAIHDTDSYRLFYDTSRKNLSLKESIDKFNSWFMYMAQYLKTFESIARQTPKLDFLKLSHKFQHLNFIFKDTLDMRKIRQDERIDPFPTMCLDFSDNIATLKKFEFITKDSVIYSVDLNKIPKCLYDSYNRKHDYKISFNNVDVGININNNELMKIQNGYCIYWPWHYSIEDLIKNKMFGFRKEKRINVMKPFCYIGSKIKRENHRLQRGRKMMNNTAVLDRGIKCLIENLGMLEAGQFIYMLKSQPFDYTEWRKTNLCPGMTVDEISDAADAYCRENP